MPGEAFEAGITLTPRVDRHSRVTVRQVYYSVPARFIGARVRVLLRAEEVLAFDGARLVARHERSRARGGQVLDLDHYLEVLIRKPGALPGAMALSQARAAGVFTAAHEAFWTRARTVHGDGDGTRALIEVLLLHRHLPAAAVIAGIRAALAVGSTSPEVVAVEARRAATATTAADVGGQAGKVIVLPVRSNPSTGPCDPGEAADQNEHNVDDAVVDISRRLAALPGQRPLPSLAHYDDLLTRPTEATGPVNADTCEPDLPTG